MPEDKERLQSLLREAKEPYLKKYEKRIADVKPLWEASQRKVPDPREIEPYIAFCDTKELRDLWFYGRVVVSTAPYSGAVGRRMTYLVRDKHTDFILGMVMLMSDLNIPVRDKYIGWDKEAMWGNKRINYLMNMSVCVPTPELSKYLTGKLTALSVTSKEVLDALDSKYHEMAMITTTSLFKKSSMYNRLKGFTYLGLTKGSSSLLVPLSVKEQMREDFKREKGKHAEIYEKEDGTVVKYGVTKTFQKLKKYHETEQIENQRGVYVIPVADNWKEFLCCETDKLIVSPRESFEEVFRYWRERWFEGRYERLQTV